MGSHEAVNQPFTAQGLYIGGVYPFTIGQTISPSLIQERIKKSSFFCLDFPDREKFVEYRTEMHDPEHSWHDSAQVLFFETLLHMVTLSTGRKLEAVPFCAYLSVYPSGFATIIFWIRMSKYDFQGDEIIELTALARGTTERIKPLQKSSIDVQWGNELIIVNNIVKICEMIEEEFSSKFLQKSGDKKPSIQLSYPIVYVQEVCNCKTASDIIERYPQTITGLSNLWLGISSYLNQEEVRRTIEGNTNPFEVGASFVSTCCTIELHPEIDKAFLKLTGLDSEQNHFLERTHLAFNCEFPVIQFFILRTYDAKLSKMHERLSPTRRLLFNPFYAFRLMFSAIQLTKLQQQLTLDINQFRGIYLLRKSYLQQSFNAHRAAFGTSNVEESIDKKLLALQNHLSTIYSMLTTIFILMLSVLAVIFGLIQTIGALRSLGWLP
jgi:hypothetical protein